MIPSTSLPPLNFFSGTTPEAQEAAILNVIKGWRLQAIANPWEDQINPGLKDREQLQNIMEVWNSRVKDVTQACDNHVEDLLAGLKNQVNSFFQGYIKINDHFKEHRNINGVQAEYNTVIGHFSASEIESERVVLGLKARLKAIQNEWDILMERLKQNRFKCQAQLDQEEAIGKACFICEKSIKRVDEIRHKVRSAYADLFVIGAKDPVCNEPEAIIDEINFMGTHLLPLFNRDTRKAFFEKNKEATPFLIFLTAYCCIFGSLATEVLPWFLTYDLRREIELFRRENRSKDLSISFLQEEKFSADFREFGPWRCSLKDNPPLEGVLKISDKMLENKEFLTNFFDCWHALADFPDPDQYKSYEAYQAHKKKKIEEAKTSSEFLIAG